MNSFQHTLRLCDSFFAPWVGVCTPTLRNPECDEESDEEEALPQVTFSSAFFGYTLEIN